MVRTGAGRIPIRGIGVVRLTDSNHRKIILRNVLYVPGLNANLVSIRALCLHGMRIKIGYEHMSFYRNRTLVMRANVEENLYIIRWFSKDIEDCAYTVEEIQEMLMLGPHTSREKKERELYDLWHRRMGHLRKSKLRHLHKITNLKTPIPCRAEPKFCEVCETTKMLKRISKEAGERK